MKHFAVIVDSFFRHIVIILKHKSKLVKKLNPIRTFKGRFDRISSFHNECLKFSVKLFSKEYEDEILLKESKIWEIYMK